jgi:hypothetical protein
MTTRQMRPIRDTTALEQARAIIEASLPPIERRERVPLLQADGVWSPPTCSRRAMSRRLRARPWTGSLVAPKTRSVLAALSFNPCACSKSLHGPDPDCDRRRAHVRRDCHGCTAMRKSTMPQPRSAPDLESNCKTIRPRNRQVKRTAYAIVISRIRRRRRRSGLTGLSAARSKGMFPNGSMMRNNVTTAERMSPQR